MLRQRPCGLHVLLLKLFVTIIQVSKGNNMKEKDVLVLLEQLASLNYCCAYIKLHLVIYFFFFLILFLFK